MRIFDGTKIPLLNRALDAYALRHKTIAANVANIATPGYTAKAVSFEDELAGAMQGGSIPGTLTNEHHIPVGGGSIEQAQGQIVEETAPDGSAGDPLASGVNNVDIDHEMAELAKNQIRFRFSTRIITATFKQLQESIRGTQ